MKDGTDEEFMKEAETLMDGFLAEMLKKHTKVSDKEIEQIVKSPWADIEIEPSNKE